ncbi:MAG: hypothetical protein EA386_04375 [Rhodobacteraceae bacterium]|nr:MAG: hypothetical protein EA386_04375 [Paracoccaceae bacterium]
MTRRNLMASTSLVFVLGLAACAPTPSAPPPVDPPPPTADEPFATDPEPMDEPFQDDMAPAPMPMD